MVAETDAPRGARPPKWVQIPVTPEEPPSLLSSSVNPAVEDPWIGRVFGEKYRILERLGAGGMAVVYLAQEQGLIKREVAIKVLTPESALSQGTIARFLKEAQAIADIRHPNVVQLIEIGRTGDGQIYLVMERLVGKTLHQLLVDMAAAEQVFSWEQLAPLILQICSALNVAHRQKIIHRDMKPSNCFCSDVDGQWHVKILDFGIAKAQTGGSSDNSMETPLTMEGTFLGTPHYAAPEVIQQRSDQTLDGRTDIFALGVMMYQCLTGTLPFQDVRNDRVAVMYRTARERPEPPQTRAPERGISTEVEAIVMRALEIDLEKRFQTVGELADAIRATLRAGTPSASASNASVVRGSIVEIVSRPGPGVPHEAATMASGEGVRPPRVRVRNTPVLETATPIPSRDPSLQKTNESPTIAHAHGHRAKLAGTAVLVAMLLGLAILLVLIVHETSGRDEVKTAPEPRGRSVASPQMHEPSTPTAAPPKPAPPREVPPSPVPDADDAAPAQSAPAAVDPPTEAENRAPQRLADDKVPPPPARGGDAESARRKIALEHLRGIERGDAIVACLPLSLKFADGVHDELPLAVNIDTSGKAKVTISKRNVAQRLPKSADACIIQLIERHTFPPGGALSTTYTMKFD